MCILCKDIRIDIHIMFTDYNLKGGIFFDLTSGLVEEISEKSRIGIFSSFENKRENSFSS